LEVHALALSLRRFRAILNPGGIKDGISIGIRSMALTELVTITNRWGILVLKVDDIANSPTAATAYLPIVETLTVSVVYRVGWILASKQNISLVIISIDTAAGCSWQQLGLRLGAGADDAKGKQR
jgi:hypothetical protein